MMAKASMRRASTAPAGGFTKTERVAKHIDLTTSPRGSQAFRFDVERLLSALLNENEPYPKHVTDGLMFLHESNRAHGIDLAGIVIYLDKQRVDPFFVRLGFDLQDRRLLSGKASIGFSDCIPAPYGSSAHNQIENRLLADPFARHNWRHRYVGDGKGWRRL